MTREVLDDVLLYQLDSQIRVVDALNLMTNAADCKTMSDEDWS